MPTMLLVALLGLIGATSSEPLRWESLQCGQAYYKALDGSNPWNVEEEPVADNSSMYDAPVDDEVANVSSTQPPKVLFNQTFGHDASSLFAKLMTCRHNYWRQAAGIEPIEWSQEVSHFSQFWMDKLESRDFKCQFKGSAWESTLVTPDNTTYGESMIQFRLDSAWIHPDDVFGVVDTWFKEIRRYTYPGMERQFTECGNSYMDIANFTRMMWHDIQTFGCGYTEKCGFVQCNYGQYPNRVADPRQNITAPQYVFDIHQASRLNDWEVVAKMSGYKSCSEPTDGKDEVKFRKVRNPIYPEKLPGPPIPKINTTTPLMTEPVTDYETTAFSAQLLCNEILSVFILASIHYI